MGLRFIDGPELAAVLPMSAAVDCLEDGFGQEVLPVAPLRSLVKTSAGDLLIMPASAEWGTGVKLVTVNRWNPSRGLPLIHAVYVLFAGDSMAPLVAIEGAALTAIRTAAVSGLATRHLARADARRLVMFGAGTQAHSHLEAMLAVRPSIAEVGVVSRSREPAERLTERARSMGLDAVTEAHDAVARADIVCTCTTSSEPLFDGSLLRSGTHVNAVGAYQPHTRELDTQTVMRARIVVETREVALAEAGDLLIPMSSGLIDSSAIVADLSEVVRGAVVRRTPDDVTVFKSVGVAFEDLMVARAVFERIQG